MSPCDIPLQLSMKSFSSFHMEPEAEVPPAKPLTALFMPVPLHEVLGECTGPVSLSTPTPLPWQSSLPGLYHLAVTPRVPLLPEVSLHSVLVMNALMVDDQSMVASLEGFASISRAEWGTQWEAPFLQFLQNWLPITAVLQRLPSAIPQGNILGTRESVGLVRKLFLATQHSGCRRSF